MGGARLLLLIGALAACASSCKPRERTEEATPAAASAPEPLPSASAPAAAAECRADEDCLPINCCYALQPSACVTRARARCDGFSITCEPYTGPRFACACVKGECLGNPSAAKEPDAGTKAASTWAVGDLADTAVLGVIMKHGTDVKACRAQAKKVSGTVAVAWSVLPTGAVDHAVVTSATVTSAKIPPCLTKKIVKWRFPKAKGPTRVNYSFEFRG